MRLIKLIFQSVAILTFLGTAGLMFNYLSESSLSNPFIANTVETQQEV
ncbi:hypothetical protein PCC8801_3421 [Rippkaea orientalis PCC 8801]|uniref:Uncharacterized protein n=1 Tax=Rippkaea orientalis (strain PCC 8801 / RF-1) TaxID=41431 RepID=B7K0A5_RIPO1|nr:hypothetical protein [Rippkaea orientalis]ACK67389.1 hypothetical protein PCC8801_3421 [Rippkaea orientalis PCC 8801]